MEQPKRKRGRPPLPEHLKKKKTRGKYIKGELRPFLWMYKDPLEHDMHIPFLKAKAQANFRGESWELTFDDWKTLWLKRWHLRGRKPDDLCMTRNDRNGAWSLENIIIVTRLEFLKLQRGPRKRRKSNEISMIKRRKSNEISMIKTRKT